MAFLRNRQGKALVRIWLDNRAPITGSFRVDRRNAFCVWRRLRVDRAGFKPQRARRRFFIPRGHNDDMRFIRSDPCQNHLIAVILKADHRGEIALRAPVEIFHICALHIAAAGDQNQLVAGANDSMPTICSLGSNPSQRTSSAG